MRIDYSLSIVIPAYNESERIVRTLTWVERALADCLPDAKAEVVVVCDCCTDATESDVRNWDGPVETHVVSYSPNRGKGYAVRQGVLASHGDIVLFMDADGSTSLSSLPRLMAPIEKGETDIVIGSRRAPDTSLPLPQPSHRRALGLVLSLTTRLLLGLPFRDTQCGFKLFTRECAHKLFGECRNHGFAFDLDILMDAHRQGLRIREMGVEWRDTAGSKVSLPRDGMRMLQAIWRLRKEYGRGRRRGQKNTA